MCGIVGIVDRGGRLREPRWASRIDAAAACLSHRGPDDEGAWGNGHVQFRHRRLSILDLSAAGHQPMQSRSGRFSITYNGEIYNFAEVRAELETQGHRFRGQSDTEVMLEAFEEFGVDAAIQRFVGMFAFAVWDNEKRVVSLVRDRIGKKPLYYFHDADVMAFGSELKAVRALVEPDEIDVGALHQFFRFGYIPGPRTVFSRIQKVPPGSILEIPVEDPSTLRKTVFWSARKVVEGGHLRPITQPASNAYEELEALLRVAVRQRMISDVPLGAFLSGGIDSSTVVALMQAQSERPVKTFTIGFEEAAHNEAEYARKVAEHLGTDHTELYVDPGKAMAVIPRLARIFDEPFGDASAIPTLLVAELARKQVTVALSGDGGDEVFGGYNRYFVADGLRRTLRRIPRPLRHGAARVAEGVSVDRWNALLGSLQRLLPRRFRFHRPGEKVARLAQFFRANGGANFYELLVSTTPAPEELVAIGKEPSSVFRDPTAWPAAEDFTHRMMYVDTVTYLPDDIMVKVDRTTMAVSLEARAPLLDHRVVEFAWRMPLSYKVSHGRGKLPLRAILRKFVPDELIERPKAGFGVPIGEWIRGPLRDWADALLDPRRLREDGFLRPDAVRRMWLDHLNGRRDWRYQLWNILVFQLWLENNPRFARRARETIAAA